MNKLILDKHRLRFINETLAFIENRLNRSKERFNTNFKEFDPGSGRTLAARLTHASRTVKRSLLLGSVADG